MRLSVHAVLCCCCVFTSVVPLVDGATVQPGTGVKERFRVWLQSRVKRDLPNSSVTDSEECFDVHFAPEQDGNGATVSPMSSVGINVRSKRSPSGGCVFVTCAYQDLIHKLYKLAVKQLDATAPAHKIGSNGYGRRRRRRSSSNSSLLPFPTDARPLQGRDLQTGRGNVEEEAAADVSLTCEIEDMTP